jgi:hypothetical protein
MVSHSIYTNNDCCFLNNNHSFSGVGYDWWWNKDMDQAPGNLLLREAGLGFIDGHRWDTDVIDGLIRADAGGLQVTAEVVLAMLSDSTGYTAEELEEGGYDLSACDIFIFSLA